MNKLLSGGYYKVFLLRILFAFFLFSITRILFYLFNHTYFSDASFGDLFLIMFYGLRFDLSAIIACYSLFIFLSILPFHLKFKTFYQKILLYVYVITTAIALSGNLLDCGYFAFTFSRTTSDIFNVIGLGSDFITLLPQYIIDFWYLFIIWFTLIATTIWFYSKTKFIPIWNEFTKKQGRKLMILYLKEFVIFTIISGLCIVGFRGGMQLRPISLMTAGKYTSAKNVGLIMNTPFTIIKTFGKSGLTNIEYFNDTKLNSIFNPVHSYYKKDHPFKNNNVVIIILESFSKEYIGSMNKEIDQGNYKGYTPFLDSLIGESFVFTNCYANGKRSIEAIPAILAGIPSLMNDAFITSVYSGNNINSLASVLEDKKYSSSFFHGGTNGTMGFDDFIKLAGFNNYYGRTEYNNDRDFDGKWGIYDEEFLQYVAITLNNSPKPFISAIFTLSSHHPYKIPEKYSSKFKKGKLAILQSIEYSDFALKRFFQAISQKTWFDSTLFVITSDHSSESVYPEYQTRAGIYAVPLIFYQHNSKLKGSSENIVQQSDIMPSVLDYLNYDKPFIAFGENVFDSSATNFAVNYLDETYQLIYKNHSYIFDGTSGVSLYDLKKDIMMKKNILEDSPELKKEIEIITKAVIQSYTMRMLKNNMTIK